MDTLEEQFKNDLRTALEPASQSKEDSLYCSCQPPEFEQGEDSDDWYCIKCGKGADVEEHEEQEVEYYGISLSNELLPHN